MLFKFYRAKETSTHLALVCQKAPWEQSEVDEQTWKDCHMQSVELKPIQEFDFPKITKIRFVIELVNI